MLREMYRVEKKFVFEASHRLPFHDGKCSRLHGHSWVMWVVVEGENLIADGPKRDMLMDHGDISNVARGMVEEYLDHWHLNDSLGLKNPTSEAIARWAYWTLEPRIRALGDGKVKLASVRIEEGNDSSCTYSSLGVMDGKNGGGAVSLRTSCPPAKRVRRECWKRARWISCRDLVM